MRRTIVRSLGALLVATGTLVVGVIPPTSAATCQSWGTQPPSPGTNNNDLLAVTVLSACNVWAVGTRSDTPLATRTLIEHWNGTAWTVAPSPSPSDVSNELAGVGASSPKDMWAVGYSSNGTSFRPLIEHYNGLGWRAVRAPHTGTGRRPRRGRRLREEGRVGRGKHDARERRDAGVDRALERSCMEDPGKPERGDARTGSSAGSTAARPRTSGSSGIGACSGGARRRR